MCVCVYVSMCLFVCVCVRACACVQKCACMYVCVCMCVSSLLYLVRVVPFSVPLTFIGQGLRPSMAMFVLFTLMPTIEKTIGNERARFYVGIRSLTSGVRSSRFKNDRVLLESSAVRHVPHATAPYMRYVYIADLHTWSYSLPLRLCMSKWHSTLDAENDRNSRELSNCAISVF